MKFSIISPDIEDAIYHKSIDLRHNELFKEFNLSFSAVLDSDEFRSQIAILSENENLLACCRLNFKDSEIILTQMAVKKELRKTGLGKELLNNIIKKYSGSSYNKIKLSAREHVIKFYKKLGFKEVGEIHYTDKSGLPHKNMIFHFKNH
jgi:ElaA protein